MVISTYRLTHTIDARIHRLNQLFTVGSGGHHTRRFHRSVDGASIEPERRGAAECGEDNRRNNLHDASFLQLWLRKSSSIQWIPVE